MEAWHSGAPIMQLQQQKSNMDKVIIDCLNGQFETIDGLMKERNKDRQYIKDLEEENVKFDNDLDDALARIIELEDLVEEYEKILYPPFH